MSKDTIDKVAELFLKPGHVNHDVSKVVLSKDDIEKALTKHDNWFTQLKPKVQIDLDSFLCRPYEAILEIARTDHQTAAILAWHHAMNRRLLMDENAELKLKLAKYEAKEKVEQTGPRAQTMLAPAEVVKPKFGQQKKTA
jgi:hypothetical protein